MAHVARRDSISILRHTVGRSTPPGCQCLVDATARARPDRDRGRPPTRASPPSAPVTALLVVDRSPCTGHEFAGGGATSRPARGAMDDLRRRLRAVHRPTRRAPGLAARATEVPATDHADDVPVAAEVLAGRRRHGRRSPMGLRRRPSPSPALRRRASTVTTYGLILAHGRPDPASRRGGHLLHTARGIPSSDPTDDPSTGSPGRRASRKARTVRRLSGGQPTEPSIWSSIRRDHSTAYSIGRVRVTGSMKPLTTMPMACSSERPRLIR